VNKENNDLIINFLLIILMVVSFVTILLSGNMLHMGYLCITALIITLLRALDYFVKNKPFIRIILFLLLFFLYFFMIYKVSHNYYYG